MDSNLYIELLKKVLIDLNRIGAVEYKPLYRNKKSIGLKVLQIIDKIFRKKDFAICRVIMVDEKKRIEGRGWPANADTMIGLKRLDNIEYCFNEVIKNNVPGDFIETGVWRGGATIFMKALLKSNKINDRTVWVADSFEGLPKPDKEKYKADEMDVHHQFEELAISIEVVKHNFKKYDLLDDNVKFLKGWFKDTLPDAPIEKLAILRLDGDMYESTMDGLVNLYHKLSIGGFIIIDDYNVVKGCRAAVDDFRKENDITEEIITIDWAGVYWRKER